MLIFLCLAAVAIDGDTLRCANIAQANGRVRIARIDAPELRQPGGPEAKTALAELIEGHKVRCRQIDADPRIPGTQKLDRFGRIVARCKAGGKQLGPAMLAAGRAIAWPKTGSM